MIDPSAALENCDPKDRTARLVRVRNGETVSKKRVFFEWKQFKLHRGATEPSEAVKRRVETLGRLLAHDSGRAAGFHTLQCTTITRLPSPNTAFALIFDLPQEYFPFGEAPMTLLRAIMSKNLARPTLEERFAMARCLVKTVFHLHSVDWQHKSIRSENILLPHRNTTDSRVAQEGVFDYENLILVGFEFPWVKEDTFTMGLDYFLCQDIYRYPDRRGPPEERFNVLHDIYALGVVLLEIGLWRVAWQFENYSRMDADSIMASLQQHAEDRLPHYMGLNYTQAVLTCLRGELWSSGDIAERQSGFTDGERLKINLSLFNVILPQVTWGA